jgi:diguanylate cyclase
MENWAMDQVWRRGGLRGLIGALKGSSQTELPDAVYRDLLSTLFAMRFVIVGFGLLSVAVGTLIYLEWNDAAIAALTASAIAVTAARVLVINAYERAGGASQPIAALQRWESRYSGLTYVFALLLAGLNVRALTIHEPLVHISTISLVFTFGAGIVSRNAGRPRLCAISLGIAVVPTALAMLAHAASGHDEPFHAEFFAFGALLLLTVTGMSLGSVRHLYASALEHLTTKHDLAKLARFDPLTGLPNRLLLRECFQSGFKSSRETDKQLAIHYLDLDGFKAINDRHGHPAGDKMLREVAERLNSILRSGDVASRLGGDEFLLIQADVRHPDQAELLARRVIRQLGELYIIDGVEMSVTVSVGVALAPACGVDMERLIACADAALYVSKARGKAQVQFFLPEDRGEVARAVA